MTTILNIPFQYQNTQVVDQDGFFTPQWQYTIEQIINFLTPLYIQQGFVIPSYTATEIAQLTNSQNGTLIYDSTNNELLVNKNGVFKTVLTT